MNYHYGRSWVVFVEGEYALRVLEGTVADQYGVRRPPLLSFAHDQDRARRVMGEPRSLLSSCSSSLP